MRTATVWKENASRDATENDVEFHLRIGRKTSAEERRSGVKPVIDPQPNTLAYVKTVAENVTRLMVLQIVKLWCVAPPGKLMKPTGSRPFGNSLRSHQDITPSPQLIATSSGQTHRVGNAIPEVVMSKGVHVKVTDT